GRLTESLGFDNCRGAVQLSPELYLCDGPAHTEISALSLHDALPIFRSGCRPRGTLRLGLKQSRAVFARSRFASCKAPHTNGVRRSEEHTSELQSLAYLVCRLLLEKKK